MKTFFDNLSEYERLHEALKLAKRNNTHPSLQICGTMDSGRNAFIHSLKDTFKYKFIVTFDDLHAKSLFSDFRDFCDAYNHKDSVVCFPATDFIFYGADMQSGAINKERIRALKAIKDANDDGLFIITTIDVLMAKLPIFDISDSGITLEPGSVIDEKAMAAKLVSYGYTRRSQVETPGEFAIRGSIIDVFPVTSDIPIRIDMWDDEIDTLKTFEPLSQRTLETVDEVTIFPASEFVLSGDEINNGIKKINAEFEKTYASLKNIKKSEEAYRLKQTVSEFLERLDISPNGLPLMSYVNFFYDNPCSFLDYLGEDTLIIMDDPVRIKDRAKVIETEFSECMESRLEGGYILPSQADVMWNYDTAFKHTSSYSRLFFSILDQKIKGITGSDIFRFSMRNINTYNKNIELLTADLRDYVKRKYKIHIVSSSLTRAKRLTTGLNNDYNLPAFFSEDRFVKPNPGNILVTYGNLNTGFEYPDALYVVISDADIFGHETKRKRKKSLYTGERIADFSAIKPGDYVVHENHGLGIYRGIEKVTVDHIVKDYVKIEYAGESNLYVPATSLDVLQKYSGGEGAKPKLNSLGSNRWNNTKARVKSAVKDIAAELVDLYAKRQSLKGFMFSEDGVWQKEFEETFPFEETEDQLNAIEDTKKDMESSRIMDRLICGDVGFGKTEIAIRAAFKAVQDGKQVVVLVPTTVLAQQHFNTFTQRMKDFPVNISLLSRFRSAGEQRTATEGLKNGYVDIVIGTHRILSKDITFKNLGLLIIDEEQRFGVSNKEKIKQLKANVDVLSLTATPIPRTLHMSLVGIRDMSLLEEAPIDRLPIQTYVMEYSPEMIKEAIRRELARGGQVYYVYNRVESIEEITATIRNLVPEAVTEYAHGRMSEHRLESIMTDFVNGNIDVLISTTIIETGLDIPNANTMIVHDSDKLGLSQLYQLRGRIGRSNKTSYAFLMYRRDKTLKEVAEKRLQAIKEFTELGSGFKIALRDLELRGAGNILGAEQSGHMEEVGYDMYCKLLNEAVIKLKKKKDAELLGGEIPNDTDDDFEDFETTIDIDINAFIPPSYIADELQKISIYRKIAAIGTNGDAEDMTDELLDRFGDPPSSVMSLIAVSVLRAKAKTVYVSEIKGNKDLIRIKMYQKAKINPANIPAFLESYDRRMTFAAEKEAVFSYKPKYAPKSTKDFLSMISSCLDDIKDKLMD